MSFARRYLLRLFSCSGDPLGLPSFPTRRSSDLGESQFYDEGRVQHQAVHDPLRGADALADSVDEGGVYDAVQGRHGLGTAEYQAAQLFAVQAAVGKEYVLPEFRGQLLHQRAVIA